MRHFVMSVIAAAIVARLFCPLYAGQGSGLDLLHRMQKALGGADKIAAIRDLDWTAKASTYDHAGKPIGEVTKRTRWIRPNYLRLDQVGPDDTYVLFFNSKSGWEILPGSSKPIELAGGELDFARKYLSGFMLTRWVDDRSADCSITLRASNTIRISCRGDSDEITLNPQTWLPAQVLEWTTVAGIRFPSHQVNSHKDDGSADIWTTSVVVNTGLKAEDLAIRPPDGQPVLVGR